MKTRTALLSLLSLVSQLNAQTTTVSCDSNEATLTGIGPGGTATFEFLIGAGAGPLLVSYSACNSDAAVGPVSIDVEDTVGGTTVTSCDSAALPCVGDDGLCFANLPDGEYAFVVSTSPTGATGDVRLTLNCSAQTQEPTASPTTDSPTTATPTTATPTTMAPQITPTTEAPTEALSTTMESTMSSTDSESFDSSSMDSESPDSSESGSISVPESGSGSDDDESGSGDSDDSDESGDVVDLGDLEDESIDAQGGNSRVDNVFEARGKTGQATTTEDMIWKYMWGVVGLFGAINVAICYCMFKNRKRAEVSFTKVELENDNDIL